MGKTLILEHEGEHFYSAEYLRNLTYDEFEELIMEKDISL